MGPLAWWLCPSAISHGRSNGFLELACYQEPYLPTVFHLQFSDLGTLRQTQPVFIEPCRLSKGMDVAPVWETACYWYLKLGD